MGRGLQKAYKPLCSILKPIGSVLVRFVILPVYKLLIMLRLRLSRLVLSARGFFFLLFTNRYVFHVVLVFISVLTIATQFRAKSATAYDAGQQSLLYAIVTSGRDEVVEEQVRPELLAKNSNYLGADTIEAAPSIDYDYESSVTQPLADVAIPGSIAVGPGSEVPGAPSPVLVTRTKTETYTVQSGDTVASIAQRFDVNVATISWANQLDRHASIKPGDTLKIPPVSGVLVVIKKGDTIEKLSRTYGADAADIYATNHLTPSHTLALGEELVIPGGTPPAEPTPLATAKSTTGRPTAVAVRTDVPKTTIRGKSYDKYQELTTAAADTRTKPPDEIPAAATPASKTKLLWPTHLHVINQYYGWQHTGVDIDGDYTDPIYAAEDGVVEKAGWNSGGYGLMILIDHQNGYQTRYGHASKLFVSAGDHVKRGQVIAMVGTTGRSTGTHLHFEVYVNNKRTNPLAYIR